MKVGDLVKRQSSRARSLPFVQLSEVGIIIAFDESEQFWNVIVCWPRTGQSWETPDDIEVIA